VNRKLGALALVTLVTGCSAGTTLVEIDGYEIPVGEDMYRGEKLYFATGWVGNADNPIPISKKPEYYVKAIEAVAGCPVNKDAMYWEVDGVIGPNPRATYREVIEIGFNPTLRATVVCK
jgi:hypothetical protein